MRIDKYIGISHYKFEDIIPDLVKQYTKRPEILDKLYLVMTDNTQKCCKEVFNFDNEFTNSCALAYDNNTGEEYIIMFIDVNQDASMLDMETLNVSDHNYTVLDCLRGIVAHECGHAESLFTCEHGTTECSGEYKIHELGCATLIEEYLAEIHKWKYAYNPYDVTRLHAQLAYLERPDSIIGVSVTPYFKITSVINEMAYNNVNHADYNLFEDIRNRYPDKEYDHYVYEQLNLLFKDYFD